jgi:hypothetical protein
LKSWCNVIILIIFSAKNLTKIAFQTKLTAIYVYKILNSDHGININGHICPTRWPVDSGKIGYKKKLKIDFYAKIDHTIVSS